MGKDATVGGAEVVETRFAIGSCAEAILGAASIAGKAPFALAALVGQTIALGCTECVLAGAVHHGSNAVLMDIAKTVVGEDKMVATIDIAVVLDDGGMAAGLCHRTDTGCLANPAGERGVEELNKDLTDIVANPFVENCADEMSVLLG